MQTHFLFNMQSAEPQSAAIWHSTFTKALGPYIKKKKQGEGGRRRWDLQDAMFKKAACGMQYSLRERRIKLGKEGLDLCIFVVIYLLFFLMRRSMHLTERSTNTDIIHRVSMVQFVKIETARLQTGNIQLHVGSLMAGWALRNVTKIIHKSIHPLSYTA